MNSPVNRVVRFLQIMLAVPMLVVFGVAAPASTLESAPEEPDEFSDEARCQLPSTDWMRVSSGAAPPDSETTTGFTHAKATKIGLLDAVRTVHSRKVDEGFNYVTAFRQVSEILRVKPPEELKMQTPKQLSAEAFRHVAVHLRAELPPQIEEETILEANEDPIDEDEQQGGPG